MDSHKRSTQIERLEVVETGRRRRWSDDEKLRIVTGELAGAARDIVDGEAPWHIALVADDMAALVPSRADWPSKRSRSGFVRAMVLAAEVEPAVAATPTSGQMVIVVGRDRRVIVDAGVDAAALARVLAGSGAPMIPVPSGVRVWIATGHTDMRKGMKGLALLVQESLGAIRMPAMSSCSAARAVR